MQEAFRFVDLPEGTVQKFAPPVHTSELILSCQTVIYITEDRVVERFDADLDYGFGEDMEKLPQTKTYQPGLLYFIRCMVEDINAKSWISPLFAVSTHFEQNSNSRNIIVVYSETIGMLPKAISVCQCLCSHLSMALASIATATVR